MFVRCCCCFCFVCFSEAIHFFSKQLLFNCFCFLLMPFHHKFNKHKIGPNKTTGNSHNKKLPTYNSKSTCWTISSNQFSTNKISTPNMLSKKKNSHNSNHEDSNNLKIHLSKISNVCGEINDSQNLVQMQQIWGWFNQYRQWKWSRKGWLNNKSWN